jgi:hypothetical protein
MKLILLGIWGGSGTTFITHSHSLALPSKNLLACSVTFSPLHALPWRLFYIPPHTHAITTGRAPQKKNVAASSSSYLPPDPLLIFLLVFTPLAPCCSFLLPCSPQTTITIASPSTPPSFLLVIYTTTSSRPREPWPILCGACQAARLRFLPLWPPHAHHCPS